MQKPSTRIVLMTLAVVLAGNVWLAGVASAETDGSSTPPAAASKSKHGKGTSSKSHATKPAKSPKPSSKKGNGSPPPAKSNAVIGSGGAIGSGGREAAGPGSTTPAAGETPPK